MTRDLSLLDATAQAALIRSGEVSSGELLRAMLERIAELDPPINAVCTLAVDAAQTQCAQADLASQRGASWGPLHGLPITIKDAIETSGIRSTGGSSALLDHLPTADAQVVSRLKAAGAIVFGKTNVPEWSGDIQTYNDMFGTTQNPWRTGYTPGGSSGGAAAAVACGFTSFEIGTDIGGSVRIPASFCGVWGHKPSFGIIPTYGYLSAIDGGLTEPDVNVFGPITRSARDLDLVLDAVVGPSPADAVAWKLELPPAPRELRGLRVAAWLDDPALPVDAGLLPIFERAAAALEEQGAIVDRSARPNFDVEAAWRLSVSLVGIATSPSQSDEQFRRAIEKSQDPALAFAVGRATRRHREWLAMDRERALMRARWAELFESFDVLLCPVTKTPAFPHLQEGSFGTRNFPINDIDRPYLELCAWPGMIGAAYLPSTVPPIGRTDDGLPVGIQVVAPYLHDRRAIAVAAWLGELVGGYEPPPGF